MQDQATALSHSVQDLQQQLRSLQASDRIQQELQPIQDDVKRTSQDLNRSVRLRNYFEKFSDCCKLQLALASVCLTAAF